jgi:hypothetical protein
VRPLPTNPTSADLAARTRDVAAVNAHATQMTAWDQTASIAQDARSDWAAAVDTLATTWQSNAGNLASLFSSLMTAGAQASSIATNAFNATQRRAGYEDLAKSFKSHVQALTTPGGKPATTTSHYYEMVDGVRENTALAAVEHAKFNGARVALRASRGLFVLGVAATVYGVYDDVQHGESTGQALASNTAGFLAAIGAGAAAGAVTGAVVGTFVPVPVVGTVAGAVVGTLVGGAVGIITSGAVDSMWENGVHGGQDVWNAIGDGCDELGDTVGDATHLVGDAASKAWHAIF